MASAAKNAILSCCFIAFLSAIPGNQAKMVVKRQISADERAPEGTSSLAFVFDTTGSMYDDLVQVREGAKRIFSTVLEQREKLIHNFVLVSFHDPEVGPVVQSTDSHYFQRKLQNLYVQGGGDCPEMALTGIKMTLEAALPASFIYVFTDARAKDYHLLDQVLNLIQSKQSQVVFVMTGDCGNRTHPGYTAFERIAAASSGQVFHLDKSDVTTVLNYVRISVQTRKVNILNIDKPIPGTYVYNVPVDYYLYGLTISLSGKDPDLQLTNPDGVTLTEDSGLLNMLKLPEVVVISVKDPKAGVWQLRTTSSTKHQVRTYGIGSIHFTPGFHSKVVIDFQQSHGRPLKGVMTYLLTNMTGLHPPGATKEISLWDLQGNQLYSAPAQNNIANPNLFYAGPLMPPDGLFYVRINGIDDKGFAYQRISLTAISAEIAGGPRAYMAARTTAFRDAQVNLSCSVDSRAPFTLFWYKDRERIAGPMFFKSSAVVEWTIPRVGRTDTGQYSCEITSPAGNDTAYTILETKEPPPHIIPPKNVTVTTGQTAYLHCRTQNTGKASITWQRRGIPLRNNDHFLVYPNGSLAIREATRVDQGPYVCHVITAGGDATAVIHVFVLQAPKASVHPETLYFAEGGTFNISCFVTGDPKPTAEWYFGGRKVTPDGTHFISYKYDLIVREASMSDAGSYECRAVSTAGIASEYSTATLAVKPQIEVSSDREMIGRGDTVTLECLVIAGIPAPSVTWYRDGREMTAFRYISIQGGRLTIQGAQDADAGLYSCIADNMAGRAEGKIKVDVGSIPTILPSPDTVSVNIERETTLQCRTTGHPVPTVSWQRNGEPINAGGRFTILPDGGLQIRAAQLADQAQYICTANNRFGQQDAVRQLLVIGLVSPVLGHVSPEEQLIEGAQLRLSCVVVLGTPKPTLSWFKNGLPLAPDPSANIVISAGGSALQIQRGSPEDEGRYTCVATNAAGNATININVQVISKPVIAEDVDEYVLIEGDRAELACRADGRPPPTITWTRQGRSMLYNSPRYTVLETGSVVLFKVEPDDAGMYTCTASNVAGVTRRAVRVIVRVGPSIVPDQTDYNAIQGQPVRMACDATGEPTPTVEWFHNGTKVTEGIGVDNSLTIDAVQYRNRGSYRCVATNIVGVATRTVQLVVHTAPVIEGGEAERVITVNVNSTVVFPCPARAVPPPTREWTYEGRQVFRGYSHGSELIFTGDGALQITTAQTQHEGRYVCQVSNVAGQDSVTYRLIVRNPPRIISDFPGTIDVVLGLTLVIKCRAVGDPPPKISWIQDGLELGSDLVDAEGTVRIDRSQLAHAGRYACIASNAAGEDTRATTVIVQEPPQILPSTPGDYTAVEGDRVEMSCFASGSPPPEIHWLRRGSRLTGDEADIEVTGGQLILTSVKSTDHGPYVCRAVNPAGQQEKDVKLTVIVPPDIPDQETTIKEEVLIGGPFSLYCPVFSTPIPQITWYLDDRPIAESSANVELSDDKRRLHVLKARTTDAGVYKCEARNQAGTSTKTFQVDVLIPPNLDESRWKRKLTVIANHSVSFGCPVSGRPEPDVSWLSNGQLLAAGQHTRGVAVSEDGRVIIIESAQLDHEGDYTCVASNKAGSLDIDVTLKVLAPPSLGDNEVITVVRGHVVSMNCDPGEQRIASTVTWFYNNVEPTATNVQQALGGRRLYIQKAELTNEGIYRCMVRNSAGESSRSFTLTVLIPPEFRDKDYEQNLEVNHGSSFTLSCHVTGNPKPEVTWQLDGRPLTVNNIDRFMSIQYSEDDQVVRVDRMLNGGPAKRFTCMAKNKAGTISRDFFAQVIAPPSLTDSDELLVVRALKGSSVTLDCPVAVTFGSMELQWSKEGRPIQRGADADVQVSLDRSRLHLVNVDESSAALYSCLASNAAGEATRQFRLIVIVSPSISGALVEQVTVIEGKPLTLRCEVDGNPQPTVSWLKDGYSLNDRAQILSDNTTVYIENSVKADQGSYFCEAQNEGGTIEKTFNVKVIAIPLMTTDSEQVTTVEVLITDAVTLECPVTNPIGVTLEWLRHEQPVVSGQNEIQILAGGRHLHLNAARHEDAGGYRCTATNEAGQATKIYELVVLVPPTITTAGGEFTVIENQSLVLACETEGFPKPVITWTKEGTDAVSLTNIELLSDGQQLRITEASINPHEGGYFCTATNKVGSADLGFDVDVISKPSVSIAIKGTIEVVVGSSADFRCPITNDGQHSEEDITWMFNWHPIEASEKYLISQSGRKLHMTDAQLSDEGTFSCRVQNPAGETTVDFKLIVLEPPSILILDKDKNRTIVENDTLTMSCPATGKPEPLIFWSKDGEELEADTVGTKILTAEILGMHQLKIGRVKVGHSGRFTCTATNKAGIAEQDITVYVMTPPRIEREGIPSEVDTLIGGRVTMSCPAYGRPYPILTWLKAGRPLFTDTERIYSSASAQKLHFVNVSADDAAHYTCIAKNPAGEDKRDFRLQLLEAPWIAGTNVPRNIQVIIGKTAVLDCPAKGSPEPKISWLKNGQPVVEEPDVRILAEGRQLQLSNADLSDTARYTCIAANRVGVVDLDIFVDVVGTPTIVDGDETELIEVIESQSVLLNCEVTGSEPLDVEWLRNGQTLQLKGVRGEAFIQVASRGRKLHFLSARTSDEAMYSCVGRNRAGEARKNFRVKVLVPPRINETESSEGLQTIIPGSELRIRCKVHGVPFPTVSWLKDEQPFAPSFIPSDVQMSDGNQTLIVPRTTEMHPGRYGCKAENKVGVAEKDFVVQLTGPPTVDHGMERKEVLVDDFVLLTCRVTGGTGQITVNWLIDDVNVEQLQISPTVRVEDRRIEISAARLSDTATYTCVVENEAGEARKNFELVVLEPPRFTDMINLSPSIVLGRPLTLDCTVVGTPDPVITWIKDGVEIPTDGGSTGEGRFVNRKQQYQLASAAETHAGRYSCVADNKAGRADKDLVVQVLMPPTLGDGEPVVKVLENDTTALECPVASGADISIEWLRNGIPLASSTVQISSSGRKLHVMRAQTKDAAHYTCIVSNEAGRVDTTIQLIVLVPPRIIGPGFKKIDSVVNQTVQIECKATGIPQPQASWTIDGRPLLAGDSVELLNNGSVLRLNTIQTSQEGRYTCIAVNSVGKAEADTYVEVTAPPIIVPGPEVIKVILGQGQTIRCEVSGLPPPEVTWLKDGSAFEKTALVHSSFDSHYIHVVEAEVKDGGRYTCIAKNRAGQDRSSIRLDVLVPPSIVEGERVLNVIENRSLTLECIASGVPKPVLAWTKDGVEIPLDDAQYQLSGNGERLTLPKAAKNDQGRFTCHANNQAGSASVDFAVDVYMKPTIKEVQRDIRVSEGERAILRCKVDAKPRAEISWLRSGRPVDTVNSNIILSPRGEQLMILDTQRTDAGSYSCVAKNAAGEADASFDVTVMVAPYIEDQIDQNPTVVKGREVLILCPVLGIPTPTVEWRLRGSPLALDTGEYTLEDGRHLRVTAATDETNHRYTCHAENEAGSLDTDYKLDVIAPPQFGGGGTREVTVVEGASVTLDCEVEASPAPTISWLRGGDTAVYLDEHLWVSADGQQITIGQAKLSDGGKYVCRATNVAGTNDVQIHLRVLVPPSIDKSNIIGNPLAILNRTISLECPVSGIPQPTVKWLKEGQPIPPWASNTDEDARISYSNNKQSIRISGVQKEDQGRYTCVAENEAGTAEQDFNLEVMIPPILSTTGRQKITKHVDESLTLNCPVLTPSGSGPPLEMDIIWAKDGRPLEPLALPNIRLSSGGRRLHVTALKVADAAVFACIASNRAGESQMEFELEVLSPPLIDASRNDAHPKVTVGNAHTLWCMVSGHPFPSVKWLKDGEPLTDEQLVAEYALSERDQALQITVAEAKHAARFTCVAENAAGKADHDISLDVWLRPTVSISGDETVKPLEAPITLLCQAAGNPMPTLLWAKDGQTLISSATGARVSSDGGRLDIPRLREEDVGEYTCTATNDAGVASASVEVDVLVPPKINRDGVEFSPRLRSETTLTLHCQIIEGKPTPDLEWYRGDVRLDRTADNIDLSTDGTYIQIKDITTADKGVYKCVATNIAGSDEILYNVEVIEAPRIGGGATIQVVEGEDGVLDCDAFGTPPPNITWFRNGRRVTAQDRFYIDGKTLRIASSRSTDAGIYLCTATNDAGVDQQAYTLEVLVPPKITSLTPDEITVPVGGPFKIDCKATGYPTPRIQWYQGENLIQSGLAGHIVMDDGTLEVLTAADRELIDYRCQAKNDAGEDDKDFKVKTIRPPKANEDGVRVINVTQGNPTMMICEVEAETAPEIIWYKGQGVFDAFEQPRANLENNGRTLNLEDTRLTDEGDYHCVAKNPAGNATILFRLNVGVLPAISEEPRRVITNNNSRADIPCEAVGVPQPEIDWLQGDDPVEFEGDLERRGDSMVFRRAQPSDAGVYTCRASNWVGDVYKSITLIVQVPPQVIPETMNVSTAERQTVLIPCNATGVPQPTVSWFKEPNVQIVTGQKYNILGTSLAIRDVEASDDSFYRCVATNDAGQAIGYRKLNVEVSKKNYKVIWVQCDEQGRPVRTTYVPARGDVPDNSDALLPWKTEFQDLPENGTNGVLIRCLPIRDPQTHIGENDNRKPTLIKLPRTQEVREGSTLELTCSAVAVPTPEIVWLREGVELPAEVGDGSRSGESTLRVRDIKESNAGAYVCVARNAYGSTTAEAVITVNDGNAPRSVAHTAVNPGKDIWTRRVAILDCRTRRMPHKQIVWNRNGVVVTSDNKAHVLKNGSLVVFEPFDKDELAKYTCVVSDRPSEVQFTHATVNEVRPVVSVFPKRLSMSALSTAFLHCEVRAEPLTTMVTWYKSQSADQEMIPVFLSHRILLHRNNTLEIRGVTRADQGRYRCAAENGVGRAYDETILILAAVPSRMTGKLVGSLNGVQFASQPLYANITATEHTNRIYVEMYRMPNEFGPTGRTALGLASCPTFTLANADPGAASGYQLTNGRYTQKTNYRFLTGEKLAVRQQGMGVNAKTGHLGMEVLVEGNVPQIEGDTQMVTMDPYDESYVQRGPGRLYGRGSATMRIGSHFAVPFSWDHDITYDPSTGEVLQTPSQTVHVLAQTGVGPRGAMLIEARTQPFVRCPTGYHQEPGKTICVDMDECAASPLPCTQSGQLCTNTVGGYVCSGGNCSVSGTYMSDNGSCIGIRADNRAIMAAMKQRRHSPRVFQTGGCAEDERWDGAKCVNAADECERRQPCQYQCHPIRAGGYKCTCPEGYKVADDGHTCEDVNECSTGLAQCGFDEICFNRRPSFSCISNPCPMGYRLHSASMQCRLDMMHPGMSSSAARVVQIQLVSLPNGIPSHTDLLRLSAFDDRGRLLRRTRFTIRNHKIPFNHNRVPFSIRLESGRGLLYSTHILKKPAEYRLGIRAVSFSDGFEQTKYQTDFLVFVSIGRYPF